MKYSIIIPVRNGGDYFRQCIQSVLAQRFGDFNLLILDNSSRDGGLDWLQSLGDKRVRIFPSQSDLDITENWGRIRTLEKNEFMMIIGHDDLLDENYLGVINELIKAHPNATVYQTHFRYIDANNALIRKCLPMAEVQQPTDVVHNFLCSKMDIMGTGFMVRSADYDSVGGIQPYPNLLFADMELWIELARKGYLAVSDKECFSYRVHPAAMTATSTDLKVYEAFKQFVTYLEDLKGRAPDLGPVIAHDCEVLLSHYCQGITHRILRTPRTKRLTPSVSEVVDEFRDFGLRLKGDQSFDPLRSGKVRMGKFIDNNILLHFLFLFFKRVYRKPVF